MNQKYRLVDATHSHDMTLFLKSVCIGSSEKVMIHKIGVKDGNQLKERLEEYMAEPPECALRMIEYYQSSTHVYVVLEDAEPVRLVGMKMEKLLDAMLLIKRLVCNYQGLNHKKMYIKDGELKIYWIDCCEDTILYKPPESYLKIRGNKPINDQSLVWKLGIIYYFCLVGEKINTANQNYQSLYRLMMKEIDDMVRKHSCFSDICCLLKNMLKLSMNQRITFKMVEHSIQILKAKQQKSTLLQRTGAFYRQSTSFYDKQNSSSFLGKLLPQNYSFKVSNTRSVKEESRSLVKGPSIYKKNKSNSNSSGIFNFFNRQKSAPKPSFSMTTTTTSLMMSRFSKNQSQQTDYNRILNKLKAFEQEKKLQCLQHIQKLRLSKKIHPHKNPQIQPNISIHRPSSRRNTSHRSSDKKSSKRTGRQSSPRPQLIKNILKQSNFDLFTNTKQSFEVNFDRQPQILQTKQNPNKSYRISRKQSQKKNEVEQFDLETIELVKSTVRQSTIKKQNAPVIQKQNCKEQTKKEIKEQRLVQLKPPTLQTPNNSSKRQKRISINTKSESSSQKSVQVEKEPPKRRNIFDKSQQQNWQIRNSPKPSVPAANNEGLKKATQQSTYIKALSSSLDVKELLKIYNLLGQTVRFASSNLKEDKSIWMVPCFFIYKYYYGFREKLVVQIQKKIEQSKALEQLTSQNAKIASGLTVMCNAIRKSSKFEEKFVGYSHFVHEQLINEEQTEQIITFLADHYTLFLSELIKKKTMYLYKKCLKANLKYVCLIALCVIIIDQEFVVDQKINPIIFWQEFQSKLNEVNQCEILIPVYTQQLDFKINTLMKKYKH